MRVALLYLVSLPVLLGTWARLAFVLEGTEGAPWLDQRYADHPLLTVLHLLPGVLFFLLAPLQFVPRLRRGGWHRWAGRLFIASGVVSGGGVCVMVWVFPAVGGALTQWVTMAIVAAMAGFMVHGWRAIRAGRVVAHRHAMMRAYALGLSVSTTRIVIDLADWIAGIGFLDSFVAASAVGVAVNVAVTEALIRR